MRLQLKNISLPLASFTLTVDVALTGRVMAVFGRSGAGKTSLLDLIAGLRTAQSALIQLDDAVLEDTTRRFFLPPQRRRIGYVPQDIALFPHLSVRQNLMYGRREEQSADTRFAFDHVVDTLEIRPLLDRGIGRLSGGEKQRVALARALMASPRLLLLDEPLASLDGPLKARIIPYFLRIRDEFQVPILYVTHDRTEVMALADEVMVLEDGQVIRQGTPGEILAPDGLRD